MDSKKIKLEILGLSSSQSQTGSFALVLGEESGSRRFPIIIGMYEAQAIAIKIEGIVPNRPLTHDLIGSFAQHFNFYVEEVIISLLKEGVFYAKILCSDGIKHYEVDARPSDAIAFGLRFDAPIYTYENILSDVGVVLADEKEVETILEQETAVGSEDQETKKDIEDFPIGKLQDMLKRAIEEEDYEIAAKIRDELNRRN